MINRILGAFGGSRGKEGSPQRVQPTSEERQRSFERASQPSYDPDNGILLMFNGQEPQDVKTKLKGQFPDNPKRVDEVLGKFVVKANTRSEIDVEQLRPGLLDLFENDPEKVDGVIGRITEARKEIAQAQTRSQG